MSETPRQIGDLRQAPASERPAADPPLASARARHRPLVSLVVPAFNEAGVLEENLGRLCTYMESLSDRYRWELIVVNDGSTDDTGELAERFAAGRQNVSVLHHRTNFGLGQAFQFAFGRSRGDYVVTLDIDLSYSPEHIEKLLERIRQSGAKVVAASPYARGGRLSAVPWLRRTLSVWANRFLSLAAQRSLSTLTGMVRAYDARFLRKLNLRSMGMEINPEIIYKSMLLHGRIDEIPAHLDWGLQRAKAGRRRSSMRVFRHMMSVLLSGFLFRPVMFFILPGLLILTVAAYATLWVFIHLAEQYPSYAHLPWILSRISGATAAAFQISPHSFLVSGISLLLGIQLISLGILALQSRSYFEEIFSLGSRMLGESRELVREAAERSGRAEGSDSPPQG